MPANIMTIPDIFWRILPIRALFLRSGANFSKASPTIINGRPSPIP